MVLADLILPSYPLTWPRKSADSENRHCGKTRQATQGQWPVSSSDSFPFRIHRLHPAAHCWWWERYGDIDDDNDNGTNSSSRSFTSASLDQSDVGLCVLGKVFVCSLSVKVNERIRPANSRRLSMVLKSRLMLACCWSEKVSSPYRYGSAIVR